MADELWRQCAAWLTRCKVIPPDHKANLPDSEIRVLALTLRDGVLLCNLLNFIDPNALDTKDFNRKPQMAQVCFSANHKLFIVNEKRRIAIGFLAVRRERNVRSLKFIISRMFVDVLLLIFLLFPFHIHSHFVLFCRCVSTLHLIIPRFHCSDFFLTSFMRQFLCYQNIKLFLDTCKNYYGLKESDLFEPTMLYHLTNFHRVLITLSKLSKKVAQIHPTLP